MAAELFTALIASSIGVGLFLYGKKARRAPQMAVGIALMGAPYFLPGVLWIILVTVASLVGLWWASRAGLMGNG